MKYPELEGLIRDVRDFPKPGIVFKDITPVLANPAAFARVLDAFTEAAAAYRPDVIVGIESRGFLFGAPLALRLVKPFVPVRKVGKLPYTTLREDYDLEYGTAAVEVHSDAIERGQRVLIIDDLLATGGTASACVRLVERLEGQVAACLFVIELEFLKGRERLGQSPVASLVRVS